MESFGSCDVTGNQQEDTETKPLARSSVGVIVTPCFHRDRRHCIIKLSTLGTRSTLDKTDFVFGPLLQLTRSPSLPLPGHGGFTTPEEKNEVQLGSKQIY